MPEVKPTPSTGAKKPDLQHKYDTTKAPISATPQTTEPVKAPDPKAAPVASEKKPEEKPNAAEPKATPAVGEKKPEEKPKATDPKVAPTAGEKIPEEKNKVPKPKAVTTMGEKKPGEKPEAPEAKTAPTVEDKKSEAKPIVVAGTGKTEIPLEPRPIGASKDVPAADPKGKNETVEPPKGVRITQVFADRLESPSQKDLESLPIPCEGEGFSMRLHPAYFFEFLDHPFSVNRETDDYRELFDSIKENGINEPIKARPREKGGLELISGHRRHDVAMQLNYPVPVVIVQADDDSARIEVVDGNLHRKDIPTSELARAAKMKLEAISRKVGRRSKIDQLTFPPKRSDQIVAEEMGYSRTQLTRLVRIDNLIPELKQMVDSKKVPFNVGVELSYMNPQEQKDLVNVMRREQTVPSLAQAQRMKEESQKAAKAAKEAAKAPKPPLQVVAPKQPESAPAQGSAPTAKSDLPSYPTSTSEKYPYTPSSPAQLTPPAPEPAPKPPAPVDEKKFASIMKNKPEPELKVIFTGAELKSYFAGQTPTVPEVKRAVFDALDLRKKALEKQAKKQEVTNPTR